MLTKQSQLRLIDDLVSIYDERGKLLLKNCYASVQLSSGNFFSMHAMEKRVQFTTDRTIVEAGGDEVLPHLKWEAVLLNSRTAKIVLSVKNTTNVSMPIERLDVLISRTGYRNINTQDLYMRRTGWQMSSPAAVRVPFDAEDPWMQPPLHMPMALPSSPDQRHLAWMTVLQSRADKPLLLGFGKAENYLGVIDVTASTKGHRITTSNYVEGVELAPGESFVSEPFLMMWGKPEQDLLDEYGSYVGEAMSARVPKKVPTGWSHWLYYFAKVTEADILENTRVIHEKNLPLEYIQIDDGYQTYFGDWLSINDKFPSGMKYIADKIRETGRKPGIWLSPFMADARSELVRQHPDWFLHDFSGRIINVNRHGDPYWSAPNYGLDVTHPEAYKWLKDVLVTMCETWGYEYLKIDFLYAGAIRAKRYDPHCTSVQAYRKGMELIREVAGDRIVLGCGAPLLCSVGLVDDMRIGPDLSWEFDKPGFKRPPDHTIPLSREPILSLCSHMWMNKKLWVNDFDYVRTRQHDINMEWPQTVALTTLIAMGGGALYNSDKLATLEPEGYELLDRLFPPADITTRPVGKVEGKPGKLLASSTKGDGEWHIAAKFNWKEKPVSSVFVPRRWELPSGLYHVYDLLEDRYLGMNAYTYLKDIPSKGVGLYSLCSVKDRPQAVASNSHLLGPAGDIANVTWRDNKLEITLAESTRSRTKLYIHVPLNYRLRGYEGCKVIEKDLMILVMEADQPTCTIAFKPLLPFRKK